MQIGELQYLAAAAVLHLAIPAAAAIAPDHQLAFSSLSSSARVRVELEVDISDFELPIEERYVDQLPLDQQRVVSCER